MSTVDEIEAAIQKLSLAERAELERRLHGWTDDQWDNQVRRDVAAGKLNDLLAEVDDEAKSGRLRDHP